MNIQDFLADSVFHIQTVERAPIIATVTALKTVREEHGRVFCIGNGGGQAHASHFAADLRKIGRIEAWAWGDNVADVTAWVNDESWEVSTSRWLRRAKPHSGDAVFVFSVGGSDGETSRNLMIAMEDAISRRAVLILGIVGKGGGRAAELGDPIILGTSDTCTVEGIQSVVAHCIIEQLRCD